MHAIQYFFLPKNDVGSDLTSHFMPKNDVRSDLTSHCMPKNDVIQLKSMQFDTIQCNSMRFNANCASGPPGAVSLYDR